MRLWSGGDSSPTRGGGGVASDAGHAALSNWVRMSGEVSTSNRLPHRLHDADT